MIAEVSNHLLLQIELNNFIDSCILLTEWSSSRVRSYSDIAEQENNFDRPIKVYVMILNFI